MENALDGMGILKATGQLAELAEIRRRQAEKWAEVQRLAQLCVTDRKCGSERVADLLAEIGAIHNTPVAKRDWIGQ